MLAYKYRFHGHGSLRYVYKNGQTIRSHLMTIKYTHNKRRKNPRFSVVVSKKVLKSAVGRNRIRRRVYEALYQTRAIDIKPHDVVVIITSQDVKNIEFDELKIVFDNLISTIEKPNIN